MVAGTALALKIESGAGGVVLFGRTVSVKVCELLGPVAVMIAVSVPLTAAALAENVCEVAPPGTEMLDGTVKDVLPLRRDIVTALLGALASPTSQAVEFPEYMVAGTHWKEEIRITGGEAGSRSTVKLLVVPFACALRVTTSLLDTCDAFPVNDTEPLPAGAVTLAGLDKLELLLLSRTGNPPLGAVPFNVAVQVVDPGVVMLLGLQESPLKLTDRKSVV